MKRHFCRVEDAIETIRGGQMVIVVDSEDREDEGDLVVAAEAATPATIHFMITYGRGLVCVPLVAEFARRLELPPMVPDAPADACCFTVPVDHVACSTGISPWDRAHTIRALLDPTSRPGDFHRPGHVFPLIARPGGVLQRPGHTEAAVELAQQAGLTPAGVLCEVCSPDGIGMANRDELFELSERFALPVLAIDELIAWRRRVARAVPVCSVSAVRVPRLCQPCGAANDPPLPTNRNQLS